MCHPVPESPDASVGNLESDLHLPELLLALPCPLALRPNRSCCQRGGALRRHVLGGAGGSSARARRGGGAGRLRRQS
eukprot:14987012-Alexandrium_andersonii.AAC.1